MVTILFLCLGGHSAYAKRSNFRGGGSSSFIVATSNFTRFAKGSFANLAAAASESFPLDYIAEAVLPDGKI